MSDINNNTHINDTTQPDSNEEKLIVESQYAAKAEEAMLPETGSQKSIFRKIIGYLIRWGLPLAFTILLVWYMFKKVNFNEMMDLIRHGVDYWWILAAMGISVLSHVFRAARWRIQLRALNIYPSFNALCCSIFGCYALNLVFPRLGELWRCTFISSRQKAHFTTVLGSLVGDRLFDTLMVLLLTLLTFFVANSAINSFLDKYPVGHDTIALVQNPIFWVIIVAGLIFVWLIFHYCRHTPVISKIISWLQQTWQGFAVIANMKGKWLFVLLTLAIWGCYFVQLYVAFYAFSFTRELCHTPGLAFGLTPCLVAFVLSSIGMAIPSNGGLGPWNIAVIFGLAVYGISDAQGTAFSMLQWTGQTVMLILLGIYTMIYIALSKRKKSAPANID